MLFYYYVYECITHNIIAVDDDDSDDVKYSNTICVQPPPHNYWTDIKK